MKRQDFETIMVIVMTVFIVGIPILVFTNMEIAVGFVTGVFDATSNIILELRSLIVRSWLWFWSF